MVDGGHLCPSASSARDIWPAVVCSVIVAPVLSPERTLPAERMTRRVVPSSCSSWHNLARANAQKQSEEKRQHERRQARDRLSRRRAASRSGDHRHLGRRRPRGQRGGPGGGSLGGGL